MTDLASFVLDGLQHLFGLGELVGVPGEVAFAICVLNIQPDEVVWNVVLIKALIHCLNIILIIVVPAALVIGQTSQWRKGLGSLYVW